MTDQHLPGQAATSRAIALPTFVKDPEFHGFDLREKLTHDEAVDRYTRQAKRDINYKNLKPTRPVVRGCVYNGVPYVMLRFDLTKRRRKIDALLFESLKAAHGETNCYLADDSFYCWIRVDAAGYASIPLYPESECESLVPKKPATVTA